jgi:hypothetical protein
MTQLKTILLVAAAVGGLSASAAASPMNVGTVQEPSLVQDARMICNERGRCFETRRPVYRDYDEDTWRREDRTSTVDLKRCGRGDTAPGARYKSRAEGPDLTLCLPRTGKTPRRG